jgi:hypothetical protein
MYGNHQTLQWQNSSSAIPPIFAKTDFIVNKLLKIFLVHYTQQCSCSCIYLEKPFTAYEAISWNQMAGVLTFPPTKV